MIILSSHYLPCIQWFQAFLSEGEEVVIDIHEHFLKQTYRNRTSILSANGKLDLTIPVKKSANHTPMFAMRIENDFAWQHQHWQAIVSAYNSAPYFLYYQDYLKPLYERKFEFLVEWNQAVLAVCLKLMKAGVEPVYSQQYCLAQTKDIDLRMVISPKNKEVVLTKPYLQVFAEKLPFEPNLSMLDVLFNHGPRWREFL
jgi:hypothetical protein